MYKQSLLRRLEYKLGRFAVRNLMSVIIGVMGLVFMLNYIFVARIGVPFSSYLAFDRDAVLSGEVWRVITFALLPPNSSPLFIIFSLYLYWMIGSALVGSVQIQCVLPYGNARDGCLWLYYRLCDELLFEYVALPRLCCAVSRI